MGITHKILLISLLTRTTPSPAGSGIKKKSCDVQKNNDNLSSTNYNKYFIVIYTHQCIDIITTVLMT